MVLKPGLELLVGGLGRGPVSSEGGRCGEQLAKTRDLRTRRLGT